MPDNERPEVDTEETPTAPEVQPDSPEVDERQKRTEKLSGRSKDELIDFVLDLRDENKDRREQVDAFEKAEKTRLAAEAQASEAKLKEEGKYKELLSEKEQELLTYQEKASRYDELESSLREDYLSKLPKKHREKYESIDIDILKGIVEDFVPEPAGSSIVDEGGRRKAEPTDWFALSVAEQQQLLSDDPAKASQLMREAGRKNQKTYR